MVIIQISGRPSMWTQLNKIKTNFSTIFREYSVSSQDANQEMTLKAKSNVHVNNNEAGFSRIFKHDEQCYSVSAFNLVADTVCVQISIINSVTLKIHPL